MPAETPLRLRFACPHCQQEVQRAVVPALSLVLCPHCAQALILDPEAFVDARAPRAQDAGHDLIETDVPKPAPATPRKRPSARAGARPSARRAAVEDPEAQTETIAEKLPSGRLSRQKALIAEGQRAWRRGRIRVHRVHLAIGLLGAAATVTVLLGVFIDRDRAVPRSLAMAHIKEAGRLFDLAWRDLCDAIGYRSRRPPPRPP